MFAEIIIENSKNFKMQQFRQTSEIVSWRTIDELLAKINSLGASAQHSLGVTSATPKWTDDQNWSTIIYWKQI